MDGLFTNSNSRHDFLGLKLERLLDNTTIYIASAFFDNYQFIEKALINNCQIRLIVRLSEGTSWHALQRIINQNNVNIRFYTSHCFHPKMYIFGDSLAYIGSSNLTNNGLTTNQEINVEIDCEESRFEELKVVFNEYWNEASVLTNSELNTFKEIMESYQRDVNSFENSMNHEIKNRLGNICFSNIEREPAYDNPINIFISDFKKKYQIFLSKHRFLEESYKKIGKRAITSNDFPLRLEIDQFLSWIRDTYAYSERYFETNQKSETDLEQNIIIRGNDFILANTDPKWIINGFEKISSRFKSPEKIDSLSKDELYEAILCIQAFKARSRWFSCGEETMMNMFLNENPIKKIKNSIKYLLFGEGDYIDRIANCIYNKEYKLIYFGQSCNKELYGWLNDKNIPICNERTLKSMQWLGFGNLM